jgi:hypothetical protein
MAAERLAKHFQTKHMCQRGEPSLKAGMLTQVAGCYVSVNVPLESINKELAMEQAPSCRSGCPVKV